MKLPFFNRSKPVEIKTGAVIKSPQVLPWHGAALREANDFNARQKRMYDAAMTDNLNADFQPTVGSANAEILTSLYLARARSRTLVKDFSTARGIIRTFKNNVVGEDPFRLEMKVGKWSADGKTFKLETETNRMIETAWKDAALPENCTVRRDMSRMEMYQLLEASALRDGSIIMRHRRGFQKNKFKYAVELVESDRLQESYMGRSKRNNPIRFSIERDEFGGPLYYYILTRHPGDVFSSYNPAVANTMREEVPAEDIIHFNNLRDRAEQDIGFPELDSIIQALHRDRQFDKAHVTAAIWAACKPFFIIQEYPTGIPYAGDPEQMAAMYASAGGSATAGNGANVGSGTGDMSGGGANRVKAVQPASGEILNFGQKPMLVDPKFPIEAATGFKRDNMLSVSQGSGLSYGSVSGDFEKYSFSSARAAMIPERDYFKVRQNHMIPNAVRLHFNEWLKYALLTQVVKLDVSRLDEFIAAANFHGKRWGYINPLQDIQAKVIELETLLTSPQEILAEGDGVMSYEQLCADNAEAKQIQEDHDLDDPMKEEATTPTLAKGAPGQTDPVTQTQQAAGTGTQNAPRKNKKRRRFNFSVQDLEGNGNGVH